MKEKHFCKELENYIDESVKEQADIYNQLDSFGICVTGGGKVIRTLGTQSKPLFSFPCFLADIKSIKAEVQSFGLVLDEFYNTRMVLLTQSVFDRLITRSGRYAGDGQVPVVAHNDHSKQFIEERGWTVLRVAGLESRE